MPRSGWEPLATWRDIEGITEKDIVVVFGFKDRMGQGGIFHFVMVFGSKSTRDRFIPIRICLVNLELSYSEDDNGVEPKDGVLVDRP